jgi:hypothetical protein
VDGDILVQRERDATRGNEKKRRTNANWEERRKKRG